MYLGGNLDRSAYGKPKKQMGASTRFKDQLDPLGRVGWDDGTLEPRRKVPARGYRAVVL